MALKRKRHELDDSPASSTSTSSSTIPSSPSPMPQIVWTCQTPNEMNTLAPFVRYDARPSDPFLEPSTSMLNSRTRKRWRTNRPDDETVHANTLQKLFNAQRRANNNTQESEEQTSMLWSAAESEPSLPQTSLHAFWNLSVPLPPPTQPDSHIGQEEPLSIANPRHWIRCDDCDIFVMYNDAMALDELGGKNLSSYSCHSCSKIICTTCAVVKDTTVCLQCANRS